MGSDTTSPSLLSRVRDPSDAAAWREFDARYGDLIVRYCCRSGLQHPDAEDIRQVVMARLAVALRSFRYRRERGRFRTYLGRVVRNEVARHFSRPNRASPPVDGSMDGAVADVDLDESSRDVDDGPWEREWRHHHMRLAMARVRQTFDARSVEVFEHLLRGGGVDEVAATFGMSTQAVHKVKQRIRARLKELVAEQIREEDQPDG